MDDGEGHVIEVTDRNGYVLESYSGDLERREPGRETVGAGRFKGMMRRRPGMRISPGAPYALHCSPAA